MYSLARKSELPKILEESLERYPKKLRGSSRSESSALNFPQAAIALLVASNTDGEDFFLLSKRAERMPTHAGQVALPGGMAEDSDAGNTITTLKREVFEEIGITKENIEWYEHSWDPMVSLHQVEVHPFLGLLKAPLTSESSLILDPHEVEVAEWIPLSQLFDENLWEMRTYRNEKTSHEFRMPVWKGWRWETWGLTAAVLNIFVSRISGRAPY